MIIKAITKVEKKAFDQIISQTPSRNMLVFHFGVGEEPDYLTLQKYLEKYGPCKIQLFPVKNYAFVQFESEQQAIALIQEQTAFENIRYSILNYPNKPRPTFFYYSKLEQCKSNVNDIPNARFDVKVPGLTLIKDFLTEQEVRVDVDNLEKRKWKSWSTWTNKSGSR